jgi:hypothetical protein
VSSAHRYPREGLEWTDTAPTKAGRYLWRKDRKWEPVYRDLVLRSDGRLYTYSERFLNWVPLSHIEAGGSQWHLEPSGDFSQK